MRQWSWALARLAVLFFPTSAWAGCQVTKFAEIPVTMVGNQAIVTAQINGRDARLILDSGAFFSTIAKANALEYGLSVREIAPGARLRGIGGDTSLAAVTAKDFRIAGQTIPRIVFVVGGSDTGYAGLLGQNILGLADAEYDLPHGIVRLMEGKNCSSTSMAYWAGSKPVTIIDLEPTDARQRHTIGTVKINGIKFKATFDSGAARSLLTLAAARRLGMTPESAEVTSSGFAYGIGQGRSRAWRARFESIELGGETIKRPWLDIAEQSLPGSDMLIGIDFFLTHHLYVDNKNHRMFVTYEGGPLFGLDPKGAVDNAGVALDLTDKDGPPTDAAGYSRRGALLASGRKLDQAIADFDKAVSLAPADPYYLRQRAEARLANHQLLLGTGDLNRAIELAPADADSRLVRAQLRLDGHDPAGALVDLEAADKALPPSAAARLRVAAMYDHAENFEAALASYDQWLQSHPEDHGRATAFNGRCWARGVLNRDLDKALSDCNAALRLQPNEPAYLDSRALVRLRRGELDKALADYKAAVAKLPRSAWSLYARGIVERRLGNAAQADTDRAAAIAIEPGVAERAKRYRLDG